MLQTTYDKAFFDKQVQEAIESARLVVPVVLQIAKPHSVVDVGCGRGAWLKAFKEAGVETVCGLDGHYIDKASLLIDPDEFQATDLSQLFAIDGHYDMAICLEVAEHLPEKNARSLINALTSAAPLVLFSAAIPGQTGTNHINEQWPIYWEKLFQERQFERMDPIRPLIWQDARIDFYYRQNIFLYASRNLIAQSERFRTEVDRSRECELELVHKDVLAKWSWLPYLSSLFLRAITRTVRRRLGSWF